MNTASSDTLAIGPCRKPAALPGQPAAPATFEDLVVPHLAAAHRLARWLVGNEHDAADAVQDASLRAFRYLRTFSGVNSRAWFLRIVRNTCYGRNARAWRSIADVFDEERHSGDRPAQDPETLLIRSGDNALVVDAMQALPDRFRQLILLRELEGLSYRELADVLGMPMGSVMSGLARARRALRQGIVALRDARDGPSRGAPGISTPSSGSGRSGSSGDRRAEEAASERRLHHVNVAAQPDAAGAPSQRGTNMRLIVTSAVVVALSLSAWACDSTYSANPGAPTPTPSPAPTPAPTPTPSAIVTIDVVGINGAQSFSPNPATLPSGQMVVWRNVDRVTHRVVLNDGALDTGDIPAGASSRAMPVNAGGPYHCSIHPSMVGSINASLSTLPSTGY